MNKDEVSFIGKLAYGPWGERQIEPSRFLARFRGGRGDPQQLIRELLDEAISSKSEDQVDAALLVGSTFGFHKSHLEPLVILSGVPWHKSHEDVVSALQEIGTGDCVESLTHLAQWIPSYLQFDEYRALASKAVWALSKIGSGKARDALSKIAESESGYISALAKEKLGADPQDLVLEMLGRAVSGKSAEEVEEALIVGQKLGFYSSQLDLLVNLSTKDWHQSHDVVVLALQEIGTAEFADTSTKNRCVDSLSKLARLVPSYVEDDQERLHSTLAVQALGAIGTEKARQALSEISESETGEVGDIAREELSYFL